MFGLLNSSVLYFVSLANKIFTRSKVESVNLLASVTAAQPVDLRHQEGSCAICSSHEIPPGLWEIQESDLIIFELKDSVAEFFFFLSGKKITEASRIYLIKFHYIISCLQIKLKRC